jgi:hypothetical protein
LPNKDQEFDESGSDSNPSEGELDLDERIEEIFELEMAKTFGIID